MADEDKDAPLWRWRMELQKNVTEVLLIVFAGVIILITLYLTFQFLKSGPPDSTQAPNVAQAPNVTQAPNVANVVAIVSSVATFMTGIVGLYFGISMRGATQAQSAEALNQAGKASAQAEQNKSDISAMRTALTEKSGGLSASTPGLAALMARTGTDAHAAAFGTGSRQPSFDYDVLAGDEEEPPQPHAISPLQENFTERLSQMPTLKSAAEVDAKTLMSRALEIAGEEADRGISRLTDIERVDEYLDLLGYPHLDDAGKPTRFCAAGLTWSAAKALCDLRGVAYTAETELAVLRGALPALRHYFLPHGNCQKMVNDAVVRGKWVGKTVAPQPGWIVFYNWSRGTTAQHVGWVVSTGDGLLRTIEFNTTAQDGPNQGNGGCVARRTRSLAPVIGFIRTY